MKTNMTTIAKPLRPQMKKARRRKPLFQPFPMSDIEISITNIEKTTSDIENLMSDIGNERYEHMDARG